MKQGTVGTVSAWAGRRAAIDLSDEVTPRGKAGFALIGPGSASSRAKRSASSVHQWRTVRPPAATSSAPGSRKLRGRDIRINTVSPGATETPGLAGLAGDNNVDDFFAYLAVQMPNGRNIMPEEVAAAVTFLESDDASGINGIDLHVDAGFAQI